MHLDSPKKKKKMRMVDVEFLPDIIIVNILSRLPVESILECKCICKAWKTLIQDPLFLTTYTARQSFFIMGYQPDIGYVESALVHYGEYRRNASDQVGCFKVTKPINSPHKWFNEDIVASWSLIGSSNGLVCLSACLLSGNEKYTYTVYIYNPMTKEYVNLGPETFAAYSNGGYREDVGYRAGFGYHPSTNEYKVIIVHYPSRHLSGHVKIYTLGGNRWRDKGEIPYVFTSLYHPGVLVNGVLHWLTNDHKIVCFDLADEKFRNVSAPLPSFVLSKHGLGVLGGSLCVYGFNNSVWVLKEESWTKIFSKENVDGPLKEEEDVVLRSCGSSAFVSNFQFEKKKVVSYDSESGSTSIVSNNIEWFNNYSRLDIVSYTKSFVSLKALGEKDVQYS